MTSSAEPKKRTRRRTTRSKKTQYLPRWKVILHDDNTNEAVDVVRAVQEITKMNKKDAEKKVLEADSDGSAILLETHQERAELYEQQFSACTPKIKVTAEKA